MKRVLVFGVIFLLVVSLGYAFTQERPTITIWGRASFAPAQAYWFNSLAYEWGAKNGVDVKITWIPVADIAPKLVTAVASGTEPDLVITACLTPNLPKGGCFYLWMKSWRS